MFYIDRVKEILKTVNCSNHVSVDTDKIFSGFNPPLQFSQYCLVYLDKELVLKGCIATDSIERISELVFKTEYAGDLTFMFSSPIPCSNVYIRIKFKQ